MLLRVPLRCYCEYCEHVTSDVCDVCVPTCIRLTELYEVTLRGYRAFCIRYAEVCAMSNL